jgi:hypothetical protein
MPSRTCPRLEETGQAQDHQVAQEGLTRRVSDRRRGPDLSTASTSTDIGSGAEESVEVAVGEEQGNDGRDETPIEQLDRNWTELLQELRVAQTGVQLLTGLLLTLPFQPAMLGLAVAGVSLVIFGMRFGPVRHSVHLAASTADG